MDAERLKGFAELIVRVGANVQEGQEVIIQAELDQPEFIKLLAEECYKAGAAEVNVEWSYQPLKLVNVKYKSLDRLGEIKKWEHEKLIHRRDTLPAMIYILSEDPNGLDGMDQEKWGKAVQMRWGIIKPIRDAMENKHQWCIAAVPGVEWARKVFPDCTDDEAVEKLWEAILYTSRAEGDAVAAWREHNAELKLRCEYLNSLGLRELRYTAPNGTDLTVGLIPEAQFLAGSEKTLGSGITYNPNIPSEEVFTSPMKGRAEGIVYSTKPLSYRGVMIENFSIRFENGKVAEVHAEKNEDTLKTMVAMDEGAAMLGECALVPCDSPISNSGIMFYNTLFDENAACHLALGDGFTGCVKDYEKYSLEELRELGINNSMIHEDFMIGFEALDILGVTEDGREIQIFKNGNWAF
ncbi:MAG: aminopeptidase [Oscillospiraceae bacterium]|nr:aminopeptidase [Oscillospiraceae bacterium]